MGFSCQDNYKFTGNVFYVYEDKDSGATKENTDWAYNSKDFCPGEDPRKPCNCDNGGAADTGSITNLDILPLKAIKYRSIPSKSLQITSLDYKCYLKNSTNTKNHCLNGALVCGDFQCNPETYSCNCIFGTSSGNCEKSRLIFM